MTTKTASELAAACGADVEGDPSTVLVGPAPLDRAAPDEISFLGHPKYRELLATTRAGAVLVDRRVPCERGDLVLLRCDDPGRAFTHVVRAFGDPPPPPPVGVHPTALVHPTAEIGADVSIGAFSSVGAETRVEDGARLWDHVSVGSRCRVGARSVLFPGVVLYARVEVGADCTLHGGSVLGADGFGFDYTREGWSRIPQLGSVVVEDEVEIGANCTIDRGRFVATRIGRGAKLDGQVHVGHNCVVGPRAMLIAQTGLSGSVHIGEGAILAGQTGVSDHVEVGPGARVGGKSGLFKDVPAGAEWIGLPARPLRDYVRAVRRTDRLGELFAELSALRRRVEELEGSAQS